MMEIIEAVLAAMDSAGRKNAPPSQAGTAPPKVIPAPAVPIPYRVVPAGPAGAAPQPPARPQAPAPPAPRTRGLLSAFRSGEGLIAAVIAAEVLAPPIALRESDGLPGR